jgi:hypothetical protein
MRGLPVYTTLHQAQVKIKVRVLLDGIWYDQDGLDREITKVWSDIRIDLTSLESVQAIEIDFTATVVADEYGKAYSLGTIEDDVDFVLRTWNGPSRDRGIKIGTVTKKNTTAKGAKVHLVGEKTISLTLSDFRGEIELTPLFVAKKKLHDRKVSTAQQKIEVSKGGILGWGDQVVVALEEEKAGLQSLFIFKWVPFSEQPGLNASDFFSVEWNTPPVIYLNQEVDNLENVLVSNASQGGPASARDALNSIIAHQAMTSVLSSLLLGAKQSMRENEEMTAEYVLESLNPMEQKVVRAWLHVADPDAIGERTPVLESLERLLAMDEVQLQRALIETLPQNLQVAFGSKNAAEKLLAQMTKGNSNAD